MQPRITKKYAAIAFVIWIAAIIAAGMRIEAYSHTPGAAGDSPVQWPVGVRLHLDPARPTLIMFVHPHCPCSRASVDELERLMSNCQGKVAAHVVFIEPAGESVEWLKTDLWRWAAAIPSVEVHGDLNGEETRRFDGQTSGDVVLYDPSGRLLFHGGITASRGHSGDNAGQSAIEAFINGQRLGPDEYAGLWLSLVRSGLPDEGGPMPEVASDGAGHQLMAERTAVLFRESQEQLHRRTDRLFAVLLAVEWVAGIAAAWVISPRVWAGASNQVHWHVWAAIFLGGAIAAFPIFLTRVLPGFWLTRHAIAVGQIFTSSLLIHFTGGRIETHFQIFGSLAFLACYRDAHVLLTATLLVAADHFARGLYWPQSIFGVIRASAWRPLEHSGWVVFEDIFLLIAIRQSLQEMRAVARRQAELETVNQNIEKLVAARTEELQSEIHERKQVEFRLTTQYEATRHLASSRTLRDAAPNLLRALCEKVDWDYGGLWMVDAGANVMRCLDVYSRPGAGVDEFGTSSRQMTFARGVGGPGRVWMTGEESWILDVADDANFPRVDLARACGLHTSLMFPILVGGEVVGVFEFLSRTMRRRDDDMLMLRNIGGQVSLLVERNRADEKLAAMHDKLVDASRQAGMAEIATGVLHNVGNVLNSVNVSSSVVMSSLRKSKVASLGKIAELLAQHEGDVASFIGGDPRGKAVPGLIGQLADHLAREQGAAIKELEHLQTNVDHIKEIVKAQQAYASSPGITESLDIRASIEAALRINIAALTRNDIVVARDLSEIPPVRADKHKVIQILVNLISNARQAMTGAQRTLTIKTRCVDGKARISVCDTGSGIAPENLTRVFNHGFTTKEDGHGFGLHSSALAAREMNGSLSVRSDRPGEGAVFTLELPLADRATVAA